MSVEFSINIVVPVSSSIDDRGYSCPVGGVIVEDEERSAVRLGCGQIPEGCPVRRGIFCDVLDTVNNRKKGDHVYNRRIVYCGQQSYGQVLFSRFQSQRPGLVSDVEEQVKQRG